MKGLSTLAAIISVFSFAFIFVAFLYPQLSRFNSRWKGPAFYAGISASTLLVAALTAPAPPLAEQAWSWIDWLVLGLGGGIGIAVMTRRLWWPRTKQADDPAGQASDERPVNTQGKKSQGSKKKRSR